MLCHAVLRAVLLLHAQTADDLLCRALYALEGAWMHGFDPTTGNVRLDFENAPNRGLFLALFRHAQVRSQGLFGGGIGLTDSVIGWPADWVLNDWRACRSCMSCLSISHSCRRTTKHRST